MEIDERLQVAQRLAQGLSAPFTMQTPKGPRIAFVDDNELKRLVAFLGRVRDLDKLARLVGQLPSTAFADRSRETRESCKRISEVVPRHLKSPMSVEDALWVLGWAARLLKYEQARKGSLKPPVGDDQKASGPRRGRGQR